MPSDEVEPIQQAAAFHGLATNQAIPPKDRIAAAYQALDLYEAEVDSLAAERDRLQAHILDIDAHATPYGDLPEEPGFVGTYLLTAGALHRALGAIGRGSPSCAAEALGRRLVRDHRGINAAHRPAAFAALALDASSSCSGVADVADSIGGTGCGGARRRDTAMTDLVWHSGGDQARTFHRIAEDQRHTVCGRFVGSIENGQPVVGCLIESRRLLRGMRECRRCFGHSQPRKPILEGRRNEP